jgi:hypothetical protein
MAELFKNNVSVLLAGAINASQTTITVNDGSLLPSPSGGDFFRLTLIERNTNEIDWEIVKVSARSGNDLTVLRGQEGTTARTWADLTRCEMRATAGALEALAANTMKTDVAQTVTANKSFNDGTMILKGATSGTTTLKAAAVAGTGEVNFPTTGTLATTSQLLGGFKNKIINGDFSVWQRGVSVTPLINDLQSYTADRWVSYQTGTLTPILRLAGPTGSPYCGAWYGAAGNIEVTMLQYIESITAATLYGAPMVLGVNIYADVAKTFTISLDTANGVDAFNATTVRATTNFAHPGTGWVYTTLPYASPHADVQNGVRVLISAPTCTTGTFAIANVQLEPGSIATPFEHRPIGLELALCQRYYRQGAAGLIGCGMTYAMDSGVIVLAGEMRTAPTFAPPTAPSFRFGSADYVASAFNTAVDAGAVVIGFTCTGAANGNAGALRGSGVWSLSAEL